MAVSNRAGDHTADSLISGQVQILQPRQGFRAGTDSILLAASIADHAGPSGLDVGCGCGGALLPLAWRRPDLTIMGVDVDPDMVALARLGVEANQFGARVQSIHADIAEWAQTRENTFDFVFTNPPYFAIDTAQAPGPGKDQAYFSGIGLKAWLSACLFALRPKGHFYIIHRAAALTDILVVLDGRAGEIMVKPIASFPGSPAKRVLIRARKGLRRGETYLMPPLHLYQSKGSAQISDDLARIRAGHGLDWGSKL